MWKPIYEELDLGALDEAHAGQKISVLQNPTERMRRFFAGKFWHATDEWLNECALVLNVKPTVVSERLNQLGTDVVQWLLVPTIETDDENKAKVKFPYIYFVWLQHINATISALKVGLEIASYSAAPSANLSPFARDAMNARAINRFLRTHYTIDEVSDFNDGQIQTILILAETFGKDGV